MRCRVLFAPAPVVSERERRDGSDRYGAAAAQRAVESGGQQVSSGLVAKHPTRVRFTLIITRRRMKSPKAPVRRRVSNQWQLGGEVRGLLELAVPTSGDWISHSGLHSWRWLMDEHVISSAMRHLAVALRGLVLGGVPVYISTLHRIHRVSQFLPVSQARGWLQAGSHSSSRR